MPYYYQAYGIHVKSALDLTKSPSDASLNNTFKKPDVIVGFKSVPVLDDTFEEYNFGRVTKVRIDHRQTHLFWRNIKICSIKDGKEIIINPHTSLDISFLKSLVMSYGFAILLHQRNHLVLHGNAISINNKAVLFLGPSGSGKSTLSLALYKQGYSLLSDDLLSINLSSDEHSTIFPGFPRLKIWPDVLGLTDKSIDSLNPVHTYIDKKFFPIYADFNHKEVPIEAIYIVEKDFKTSINSLSACDSLKNLVKNSYCAKIFNYDERMENFKQCSSLVNEVPIKKLSIKHSFEDIGKLVKIIEKDV